MSELDYMDESYMHFEEENNNGGGSFDGGYHIVSHGRTPQDLPCRYCALSEDYKCVRKLKGLKCPYAPWFAEHNLKHNQKGTRQ